MVVSPMRCAKKPKPRQTGSLASGCDLPLSFTFSDFRFTPAAVATSRVFCIPVESLIFILRFALPALCVCVCAAFVRHMDQIRSPPKPYELARQCSSMGCANPSSCSHMASPVAATCSTAFIPGASSPLATSGVPASSFPSAGASLEATGVAAPAAVATGAGPSLFSGVSNAPAYYGMSSVPTFGLGYGALGGTYGLGGLGGMYGAPIMGMGMGPGVVRPGTLSNYVQVWLAAVQSIVNAVVTFSTLLNASWQSIAMSVSAVAEVSLCLRQLSSYLSADPEQIAIPGLPFTIRRRQGGLPWYILLLLLYILYRVARRLLLRILGWQLPAPGRSGRIEPSTASAEIPGKT
eukprot:RCo016559